MNPEEAKQAIADVFKHLEISRVVCVDDSYAVKAGLQDAKAMIEALISLKRFEVCVACFDGEVPFPPDSDDWRDMLEEVWSSSEEKQAGWLRHLYVGLDEAQKMTLDQPSSFVAAATLREILEQVGVEFLELAPSEWVNRQTDILSAAQASSKTLILFDHYLNNDPDYTLGDPGTKLMGRVLSNDDPCVICGLLSGRFTVGGERTAGREVTAEVGKPLSRWLPISKQRLDAPELFAEGVKVTALNYAAEQLIDKTMDISREALGDSSEHLRELSSYDLHQVVVESSRYEAVWEMDTLFRLLNVFLTSAVNQARHKSRRELDSLTDLIHRLDAVRAPSVEPPSEDVRRIRRLEMYEKEFLNTFHTHLRLGDIFQVNQRHYILLAQPCDLMVRDGTRRNPVVPLVRIHRGVRPGDQAAGQMQPGENVATAQAVAPGSLGINLETIANATFSVIPNVGGEAQDGSSDKEHILKPIYHYYADGSPHGMVNFKDVIYIPISVLDLTVFNETGQCKIDVDDMEPRGLKGLIGPWREHYADVRKEFKELVLMIEMVRKAGIKKEHSVRLEKAVIARYRPEGVGAMDFIQTSCQASITALKLPITRINHYREPWSLILLQQFAAYLGRPALEHDYAEADSSSGANATSA